MAVKDLLERTVSCKLNKNLSLSILNASTYSAQEKAETSE